jgi:hypothetical protein
MGIAKAWARPSKQVVDCGLGARSQNPVGRGQRAWGMEERRKNGMVEGWNGGVWAWSMGKLKIRRHGGPPYFSQVRSYGC